MSKSLYLIGIVIVLCFSVVGCGNKQQNNRKTDTDVNKTSVSKDKQKIVEESPVFNKDVYVIKSLWAEFLKLNQVDSDDNKKQLLIKALRTRMAELDISKMKLDKQDYLLLDEISKYLK